MKDSYSPSGATRERLKEAIASALTSLATGPAKDGYAYAVLTEALSGTDPVFPQAAKPDPESVPPESSHDDQRLRDVERGDRFRLLDAARDSGPYEATGDPERDGQWCYAIDTDKGRLVLDYADRIEILPRPDTGSEDTDA